jgi:hypothetical protein
MLPSHPKALARPAPPKLTMDGAAVSSRIKTNVMISQTAALAGALTMHPLVVAWLSKAR